MFLRVWTFVIPFPNTHLLHSKYSNSTWYTEVGFPSVCWNRLYYHWLIEKLFGTVAGQNRVRWEIQVETEEKRRWSQGDAM